MQNMAVTTNCGERHVPAGALSRNHRVENASEREAFTHLGCNTACHNPAGNHFVILKGREIFKRVRLKCDTTEESHKNTQICHLLDQALGPGCPAAGVTGGVVSMAPLRSQPPALQDVTRRPGGRLRMPLCPNTAPPPVLPAPPGPGAAGACSRLLPPPSAGGRRCEDPATPPLPEQASLPPPTTHRISPAPPRAPRHSRLRCLAPRPPP